MRIARHVREAFIRYGTGAVVHDIGYHAVNILADFQILKGMTAQLSDVSDSKLFEAPGFDGRFVSPDELARMDQARHGLSSEFLRDAGARGDRCYALFRGDELASFGWYAQAPTPIDEHFVLHFDHAYTYMFNGYTLPAYRGRRLHAIGGCAGPCGNSPSGARKDRQRRSSSLMIAFAMAGDARTGIFSAVQHARFRPLWTASITSCVAYMTALTACGWMAFDLHHHSSTVGLVVFASFLPSLIITPFAGVFTDRYDRRTMLLTMNAIGLLSTLGLAWLAWTGDLSPWPLAAVSFLLGASRSSSTPMEQAMLGSLVPARDLLSAVSLLQANVNGARLLGPLLAAPLLHVAGGTGAFLVAAVLFALAFRAIWVLGEVPHQRSGTEHNPLTQLAEGVRYVFQAPVVCAVITLVFLHCAFTMGYDAALPRRASDVLGATGSAYSLLMMAMGGGSLVGGFLLAGFAQRVHFGYLFFATSALSGLTLVPLGYSASWPGTLLAAAAVGLTQSVFIALATTSLQIVTPDHVRGRVLGLYWGATGGVMAMSNLATGRLADGLGAGTTLALPGLAFGVVTALTLSAPTLREIYGRRLASAAVPSAVGRVRSRGVGVDATD